MADKPNKNGDIFKTEYLGTWVDEAPTCFGNPRGRQHAACERCQHERECHQETDRRLGYRMVKHRDKPAPRVLFDPLVPPGKAYVLQDDRGEEKVVAAIDLAVGQDKTAVTVGHVEGGKVVRDFDMECTAQELQHIRDSITQGLGVPRELLTGDRAHPIHFYEELMKEKMAEWKRAIYGRAMEETRMSTKNYNDWANKMGPAMGAVKELNDAAKPAQIGGRLLCNNQITPPEPLTCFKAELLPQRSRGGPPLESAVQHCHTVVRVLKSRDFDQDTCLGLTPLSAVELHREYPITTPDVPEEPPPELMQKLASAVDLSVDGYATWEGVVGFVVEAMADMKKQNRRLLEQSARWESEAQRERHRANQAADAAGNAAAVLDRERRTFSATVAEMQLELRRLRKKAGER